MYETIPKSISEKILELCRQINPAAQPELVAITVEPGCEPDDCFANIRRKVEKKGGRIQYGWALWEWPRVLVEAEHHAVYEPPAGPPWQDLTPCKRRGSGRLFLPDDSAVYDFEDEGYRRDNVRLALSNDPLIEELFKAAKKRSSFYNELPGVGIITIHASEDKERQKIERRLSRATLALVEKYGPR